MSNIPEETELLNTVKWYQFNRKRLMFILFLGIPLLLSFVAVITITKTFKDSLPSLSQLENIDPRLITKVYDKDSALVHEFYVEKRIWVPIDSVPEILPNAIMAIEDRKFYDHWGINVYAIVSAVLNKVISGGQLRGASTLTQQLTKNLFLTSERSYVRKIKEALTAIKIENTYTKREILEFYINTVYLGAGAYGFEAACQYYFGHPLSELTTPEAAILAGMLKMPNRLRPDKDPEESLQRRNTVLGAMYDAGFISKKEYKQFKTMPIERNIDKEDGQDVYGEYYVEEIRKYLEKQYGQSSLYSEGVSIYTAMDSDLQKFLEVAIVNQLDTIQKKLKKKHAILLKMPRKFNLPLDTIVEHFDSLYSIFDSMYVQPEKSTPDSLRTYPDSLLYRHAQGAAIIIENKTGAVRALVGGRSFEESKFNRATQALRQPGSAFKPFVYATALDNGASPSDSINDQPITIPDPKDTSKVWRPENYSKKFSGYMTLREALYRSKNLPAIQLGLQYGLSNVVSYAKKFGINSRLWAVPSITIGSLGATVMEMTSAYSVFPNQGTRIEPYLIEKIKSKNGAIIEENFKEEHEVLSPETAFLMVNMLRDVNTRGTASKIWRSGFHHPSGGKTGTTNDYTDAWYIGFTKDYTMGVWVGTDDHRPMGRGHTGGDDAAPLWIEVMKKLHEDLPQKEFPKPPRVARVSLCPGTQLLRSPECSKGVLEYFHINQKPTEYCDCKKKPKGVDRSSTTLFSSQKKKTKKKKRVKKTF